MLAVVLDGNGGGAVATVPAPRPAAGELLVEVRLTGLCGSDVEKLAPGGAPRGAVLGHEVCGVVLEGPLPAGTRVAVAHHVPCGDCASCAAGHEPLCAQFSATNLRPGGFAQRLVASAAHVGATVLPLPDHVSDRAGALVEPLACVLRACELVPRGARVLVVGCGAIGQLFGRVLAARGHALLAAEPDAARAALAATWATAPDDAAPDVAVVTAPAGLASALDRLAPGGLGIVFAAADGLEPLPLGAIYRKELRLAGVRSTTPRHLAEALRAIAAGVVRVDDLVTDVLPLERFAEGLARYRTGAALKVAFAPARAAG